MRTSKSHLVDYGASYMTCDYTNVKKYCDYGDPIRSWDCYFIVGKTFITICNWRVWLQLPKLIPIFFTLWDYRKRLNNLRQRAIHEQQKDILASDPVLKAYVKESGKKFVKDHKLEWINENFFHPLFHSTGFTEYEKQNTFFYLDNLMAALLPSYEVDFRHAVTRLTHGWHQRIDHTTVHSLTKSKGLYRVRTSKGHYTAKNVVIAMPYKFAKKIYKKTPKPKFNIPFHVIHVVGKREDAYKNKKVVFFKPKHHEITILWRQPTGSDIVFSKTLSPPLEKYYEYHHVVKTISWDPAIVLSGDKWVSQKLDEGLYLASDYNICGLEDAFITGVYAANQILKHG